jgi:hypothetical protein
MEFDLVESLPSSVRGRPAQALHFAISCAGVSEEPAGIDVPRLPSDHGENDVGDRSATTTVYGGTARGPLGERSLDGIGDNEESPRDRQHDAMACIDVVDEAAPDPGSSTTAR